MKPTLIALSLLCLLASTPPSWAHGGEDHAPADAPPQTLQAQAQNTDQATAQATTYTDTFELVVTWSGPTAQAPTLTLYVDRFASNQPLEGATVDVESGTFKATAQAVSPGVYQVAGTAFTKPGRYPLTVSIQAGDESDLLDAMLDTRTTPAHAGSASDLGSAAAQASSTTWRRVAVGLTAALAALGMLIAGLRAYRRRAIPHKELP